MTASVNVELPVDNARAVVAAPLDLYVHGIQCNKFDKAILDRLPDRFDGYTRRKIDERGGIYSFNVSVADPSVTQDQLLEAVHAALKQFLIRGQSRLFSV